MFETIFLYTYGTIAALGILSVWGVRLWAERDELLTLIRDDLRMRMTPDGVIDISDFIWQRIKRTTGKE